MSFGLLGYYQFYFFDLPAVIGFFHPIILLVSFMLFLVVTIVLLVVTSLVGGETFDNQRRTTYECGFIPFEEYAPVLDVQFYLVALSFLLFDLEIALIIPWSVSFLSMSLLGLYSMFFFLLLLILGLIYEWQLRILDWSYAMNIW